MGKLINLFPEQEETILVCCSECGGETFHTLLYKGSLFFQCPICDEVYELIELQEATTDGM